MPTKPPSRIPDICRELESTLKDLRDNDQTPRSDNVQAAKWFTERTVAECLSELKAATTRPPVSITTLKRKPTPNESSHRKIPAYEIAVPDDEQIQELQTKIDESVSIASLKLALLRDWEGNLIETILIVAVFRPSNERLVKDALVRVRRFVRTDENGVPVDPNAVPDRPKHFRSVDPHAEVNPSGVTDSPDKVPTPFEHQMRREFNGYEGRKETLMHLGRLLRKLPKWSSYRDPQEWLRLRKLKELSHGKNEWAKLRKDNPNDIECESTKSARISFSLAEKWNLNLPEF
jgi:hypothetical protein